MSKQRFKVSSSKSSKSISKSSSMPSSKPGARFAALSLLTLCVAVFALAVTNPAEAARKKRGATSGTNSKTTSGGSRIVYPEKTDLDFEGLALEGEVRNPGEFYFQHRPEEKFDSLVKRRKNFHREMLRDVVLSK